MLTREELALFLDDRGCVRPGEWKRLDESLEPSKGELRFHVFSQHSDARLLASALRDQGQRFFAANVRLESTKSYLRAQSTEGEEFPRRDAARVIVEPGPREASYREAGAPGAQTLLLVVRPKESRDTRLADDAAFAAGGGNMDAVAARCPTVCDLYATDDQEEHALILAAILSGTFLGPIVDPRADSLGIFAVRTARERLDALTGNRA